MIVGNIIGKRLDKGKYKARKTYALERFALSTPSKYHLFSLLEKKNKGLFLCQNYRYVNAHIIQDAYPLFLISNLVNQLQEVKLFTKLDIQ